MNKDFMRRAGNIAGLVVAVMAVAGVVRAEELAPATVKGAASIQLPKGWAVNNAGGGKTLLAAIAPQRDKDETGEFQATLTITQDAGGRIDGAAQQARLSVDIKGYKPTEAPQNVAVNGLQGVMFGGSITSGALVLRSRQYIFSQNNQLYVVTFTSLNSKFGGYSGVIDASVGTFRLK